MPVRKGPRRPSDPFQAGWYAAQELANHEWGPEPPKTWQAAKALWLNTCDDGHIIRIAECAACQRRQGR